MGTALYLLPIDTRVPLKFGAEVVTKVTCARVCVRVTDRSGRSADGWGETPLSVQWVWPGTLSYERRLDVLEEFCAMLSRTWAEFEYYGHPLDVGARFIEQVLPGLLSQINRSHPERTMPWLAALVCCSAFDIALHDAYGMLHGKPIYETYNATYLEQDLESYLTPAPGSEADFRGSYPQDYLIAPPPSSLPAWHLVAGLDPLDSLEGVGATPDDGEPVLLTDWIKRDGLKCLKIKLCGNDAKWDLDRLLAVGHLAVQFDVDWLSADFNCTVMDPAYVNEVLDRLKDRSPRIYGTLLYVEQPFPYDLEAHRIDVRSVAARKPLFMDESAHDWRLVRMGRELGWSGVALKTCKTQTGAILSLCWAKAHGMPLMVQDLSNPMLAMIPHAQLAAHAGTIMGVETNASQFYPAASAAEAEVHPGLYQRRHGCIDLTSLGREGFGYRLNQIQRELLAPRSQFGVLEK